MRPSTPHSPVTATRKEHQEVYVVEMVGGDIVVRIPSQEAKNVRNDLDRTRVNDAEMHQDSHQFLRLLEVAYGSAPLRVGD